MPELTLNQRAMIIAIARMCGLTGSNQEIYDKFWETYQDVFKQEPEQKGEIEIINRPF